MQLYLANKNSKTFRWNVFLIISWWLLFMNYALWLFEFISRWTLAFVLAMAISLFPNIEKQKLTLLQIKQR